MENNCNNNCNNPVVLSKFPEIYKEHKGAIQLSKSTENNGI